MEDSTKKRITDAVAGFKKGQEGAKKTDLSDANAAYSRAASAPKRAPIYAALSDRRMKKNIKKESRAQSILKKKRKYE